MGGLGGIGAFAGGFAKSFAASREQRRLRDLDLMREQQRAAHEQRMQDEFQVQQDFRVKQQAAVEQYRAGQAELQQKQLQIQQKHLDLEVMGGLSKAFDPKIPKPQRLFMLKQTMKTLEIDPKSQEAKDFMQMASGLDDEALASTKSSLMTMLPDATPGQITAFTKSIVSGQLQMKDALEAFNKARDAKKLADINSRTGGGVPTQQVQTSRITDPTAMAQQPGMGAQQSGGNMPIPGMAQPGASGEPTAGGATAQQIRDRASELFKNGFTQEGNAQVALAHSLEEQKNVQLKEVVAPDGKNMWVPEAQAAYMEAPSARPTKTPEEERATREMQGLTDLDIEKVKKYSTDAEAAREMQAPLDAFKTANASKQFEPGTAGGLRATIARAGQFLGLHGGIWDTLKNAGLGDAKTAEVLEASASQLNVAMADKLSRVTNMSLGLITQSGLSLYRTREGNDLIAELMTKANERALKIDDKREEFVSRFGTLRPDPKKYPGQENFFSWVNKERAKPLVGPEWETKLKTVTKGADKLGTIGDMIDKARQTEVLTLNVYNPDTQKTEENKFDITGKSEKGVPLIKLQAGVEHPYVASKEDLKKLTPAEQANGFIWNDKIEGPIILYGPGEPK